MGLLDYAQMTQAPSSGLLSLSQDDQDRARQLGLLALAGQMVRGDLGGGMSAFGQTYQGALENSLKQKMMGFQAQAAQQGLQKGGIELDLLKQQVDRQNKIRDDLARLQTGGGLATPSTPAMPAQPQTSTPTMGGIPMFSQGSQVQPPQQQQTQQPQMPGQPSAQPSMPTAQGGIGRDVAQRLIQQANVYSLNGDFEGANKLYENAAKFMPEVKEIGVMMQGNTPVNVITFKDGSQQISPLAPKPDVHWLDTGSKITPINQLTMQPMAQGAAKTPTPGELLSDSRDRSQFKQTLAKDYTLGGFNPDGTPAGDMELTAKAIANGQLPPPSGMALTNPRNQRLLARVMEINPQYDFTDVTAKRKAASDFTTGTQGNALRSFAVAGQHLDQLNTLVDALNNGNTQLVNKVSNIYSQQTGNPAVTNFDAAKDVVSKEVMKAIVAGGGGVSEREELQRSLSAANSPAQLKGVIAQYRNLMSAQHDMLLQQRRAAGLSDSTIPNYGDSGAAPTGWTYLGTVK
jgi:hypothetical protein